MRPALVALLVFAVLPVSPSFAGAVEPPPAALSAAPRLARKVVDLGTHKLTYVRIAAPALPARPEPPPSPTPEPTPEEQAAEDARAAKTHVQLLLSVTVYPGNGDTPTISDLNWWKDGRRHQVWSNIDFRVFSPFRDLETPTHVFSWFPGIGEGSIHGLSAAELPAGFSRFTTADAVGYCFEGEAADAETVADTLLGLDYFHAYYDLHREALLADYARRQAEAAAREAERRKNPPKPVSTTIHFWKNPAPASP